MTSTFERLRAEVAEWSEENFGDQPAVNPLLGIGEEFGELIEHLADSNGARLADAGRPDDHERDCVGDLLVFAADFCHRRGIDFQEAYDRDGAIDAGTDDPLDGVAVAIGRLNRSVLKRRQGIRLEDPGVGPDAERRAVAALLGHLDAFARERGYAIEECLRLAWDEEVSDREWDSTYVTDGAE